VLSVPKRLRYFMRRDGPVLAMALRIFLLVIAQSLHTLRRCRPFRQSCTVHRLGGLYPPIRIEA
jgi:hypothetical protein